MTCEPTEVPSDKAVNNQLYLALNLLLGEMIFPNMAQFLKSISKRTKKAQSEEIIKKLNLGKINLDELEIKGDVIEKKYKLHLFAEYSARELAKILFKPVLLLIKLAKTPTRKLLLTFLRTKAKEGELHRMQTRVLHLEEGGWAVKADGHQDMVLD